MQRSSHKSGHHVRISNALSEKSRSLRYKVNVNKNEQEFVWSKRLFYVEFYIDSRYSCLQINEARSAGETSPRESYIIL